MIEGTRSISTMVHAGRYVSNVTEGELKTKLIEGDGKNEKTYCGPGGRPAQTLKMETVYNWVSRQPGYKVAEDGTIHKL